MANKVHNGGARWFALGLLVAVGCVPAIPPGVHAPATVLRLIATDGAPPPADRAGWEAVHLPDYWDAGLRARAVDGWYRTTLELAAMPAELWAVYLPRVSQTAAVWVNGELVGPDETGAEPLPRDWIRSHLVTVPRALLRVGVNDVAVKLRTHVGAPGYLRAIVVGPDRLLRSTYDAVVWWQVGLTQIVAGATCAAGLLVLLVAFWQPELFAWRWLALGLVAWSWGSADAFVRHVPVSTRLWEWSTGVAPLWATVCFGLGFHRILAMDSRRRDAAVLGLGATVSAGMLVAPPAYAFAGTLVAGAVAVVLAGYLVVLFVRTPHADPRLRRRFVVPAALGMLLGLHDIVGMTTGWYLGVLLSPYIPAVALVTTASLLLVRLVESHREMLALNRDLEQRVDDKRRELAENYARVSELERHRVIGEERERLMRDVHDGVGGQLVSTLALVESGEAGSDAVAESIRDALEDLRLVIDSLDPIEADLLAVLASARSRLEPRLVRHGLRFVWQVSDLPPVQGFGPEMALQAMRIVQEAVTNVVKHAGARTITVRTGESTGDRAGVFIEVRDDGHGLAPDAPRGRGLTNMARRAARLGGTIDIHADHDGTAVRLWLPRDRPTAQPT